MKKKGSIESPMLYDFHLPDKEFLEDTNWVNFTKCIKIQLSRV